MKRNIKRFTVKLTSALLLAATLMGTAATAVRADEMDAQPTECVETVVEGQGDVIDDCFAVVEGQGDVIDDCFAVAPEEAQPVEETVVETPVAEEQPVVETVVETPVVEEQPVAEVEGQGDVIDDCFAVVEGQGDIIEDQFVETEGRGDIIDDEFAVAPEEVQPVEETEVEGQGDIIDDEFAVAEGQGDIIDDEFAVVPEAEAAVEAVEAAEITTDDFVCDDALASASLSAVGGIGFLDDDSLKPFTITTQTDVNSLFWEKEEAERARKEMEAASKEEQAKQLKLLADVLSQQSEIDPKVVLDIVSNEETSYVTKTLEIINKVINPSDTKYGDKIRKQIDDSDSLGKDEKEYLKKMVTIAIGTGEGLGVKEMLPAAGTIKKGFKAAEEFSKSVDAKTAKERATHLVNGVQNTVEGAISTLPGGGPLMSAWKAIDATKDYLYNKLHSLLP